jgi:hypothetical protein
MAQIVKLRRSSVSGQKPTNSNLQLGELALNTTDGKVYMAVSGSLGPSVEELISTNAVNTGSIYLIGNVTASNFSGSFIGNASGLTNVPFAITGSDVDGINYNKQFSKLHFDSETGLNVSESAPGTAFISIGSHFRDMFVSGQPLLRATGSDSFEIIPAGGVEITTSITDTNGNGYVKELTISTTNLSSSLNNRMDTITGSIDSLNNFSSSVVLTSQTGSMTVLSASYAVTAAFALNAGGGGAGGGFAQLNQTTPSTSWTFQHNLGQKFPIFQIFDSNDNVIIPSQIIAISSDSATITFPSLQTGRAIASLGTGPGGMTQQFSAATTWSLSHNMSADYPIVTVYDTNRKIVFPNEIRSIDADNVDVYFSTPVAGYLNVAKGGHIISGSIDVSNINLTGSNVISGSSQISNLGYATTGSNIFNGNQTINGCLTINNAKICATGTTISSNTQIFNLSSFDGAFFDYVVKNGSNMRAGAIMSAWDGTNATYNETTTVDLGNTSAVGFNVSGTGTLNATISSGTWTVEVLYRALGGPTVAPTITPNPTPSPTPTLTLNPTPTPTSTPTVTPTVTITGSTNYSISTGFTISEPCNGLFGSDQTVYGNASDWLEVTRFYTDSGMTTPFNGNDLYYGNSTADYGTTLQINSSGYVINLYAC